MRSLLEYLRPPVYVPRHSEVAAAHAPLTEEPYLPPHVDITAFYGGHFYGEDFVPLEPHLAGVDIFVYEIPRWTIQDLELFSRISQGDKSARKQLSGGHKLNKFTDGITKTLQGSGIRVTTIDYSAQDDRAAEIESHFKNRGMLDKVTPSWNQTLNNIIDYAKVEGDIEGYRENIMARSIGPRLQVLIDSDPELSQMERVRVLIQQGAFHINFFDQLEAMAAETASATVRQVFGTYASEFDHFDQLAQAFKNKEHLPSERKRELAMRALARVALRANAIPLVINDRDYDHSGVPKLPSAEEMVERFSVQSIKDFHRKIVEAQGGKAKS